MHIELPAVVAQVIFGGLCAIIASSRGRNPVGWFIIGFFSFCLGLILLLVLPDLNEEESRYDRLRSENKLLRERLRKDRQVADARHDEASRRLDAHDRGLGLDTSPQAQQLVEESMHRAPPQLPRTERPQTAWWYYDGQQQVGPIPFSDLKRVFHEGRIDQETLVWEENMSDWLAVRMVNGLEDALRA